VTAGLTHHPFLQIFFAAVFVASAEAWTRRGNWFDWFDWFDGFHRFGGRDGILYTVDTSIRIRMPHAGI
jgi:hypothetical protein